MEKYSHINKEWIYGGCGDNIQYGYKYELYLLKMCSYQHTLLELLRTSLISEKEN